ncbi:MAG TPA: hypothetical protein VGK29_02670 [Paludibaculum sp.]|jgi:hypothetical protein
MKLISLFLITASALLCQTIDAIPWGAGPVFSSEASQKSAPRQTSYRAQDVVFPHLATGGGWETVIVTVNLSKVTLTYNTYYFDQAGNPMPVTLKASNGLLITTAATTSSLPPAASLSVPLLDDGTGTKVGWAAITYDATLGQVGGFATFRQRVEGRPDFEALVPLSSLVDSRFLMPVDERDGFETALAICNPGTKLTSTVTLQMLDPNGRVIANQTITLAPLQQQAFLIQDKFPTMLGQRGTLYVGGTATALSALGLRFNTLGGSAFSSIPIMNTDAMLTQ